MTCGCSKYDYHDGTLICVSPGQIGGVEYNEKRFRIEGWALLFSLELLHGTPLDSRMKNFSFFPCQVNEALHMSAGERETFIAFLKLLREELEKPHDKRQEGCTPTEYVERIRCARNS